MQKTTEIEVVNAKHLNPLTGLPGDLMIEHKIQEYVTRNEKFSIAYFDLDNFKAYNDVYGFEKGDLVIKLLATTLSHNLNNNEFIGHIGGDDFVVIVDGHASDNYFSDVVNEFEQEVLKLYSSADVKKGYITAENRHGQMEKFPMITVTHVIVTNQMQTFKNEFELTEMLAKRKQKAKQKKKDSKVLQVMLK